MALMTGIMILAILTALIFAYFAINILLILYRNHKAQKFFATHLPWIPVVPNAKVLTGNGLEILTEKFHLNWTELHAKYGETFGFYFGHEPTVATTNLDLLRKVMVNEGSKQVSRADFHSPLPEFNNSLIQVQGDTWRRMRKVTAQALSNHRIKKNDLESEIQVICGRLKDALDKKFAQAGSESIEINLGKTSRCIAMSVMGLMIFKRTDLIDFGNENDPLEESLEAMNQMMIGPLYKLAVCLPFLGSLFRLHFKLSKASRYIKVTRESVESLIEERQSSRKKSKRLDVSEKSNNHLDGKYLIDSLIDAYLDGQTSYDELLGNAILMIPAGADSTGNAMTNLFKNLALNEDIQEKLRKEIMEKGTESEYLSWCIMEAIRWCPPVPLGGGRKLVSDVTYEGRVYPKGTTIVYCSYSTNRNSDVWPEPDKFIPERFRDISKMHPAAFNAFGMGPRNCVGEKFAIFEVKILTHFYLTNYRLEKCSRTPMDLSISAPGLLWFNLDEEVYVKLTPLARKPSDDSIVVSRETAAN